MTPHSLHAATPDALERVAVVLVEPSHPGNIGAVARAMRVMGLRDLVLVSPRVADALHDGQAGAFASGATDVLERARVVHSLAEALLGTSLAVAVSADPREFGPAPLEPEATAAQVLRELAAHPQHRVALVFGTERTGLSIEQVARCQLLCSIPGEPGYHSLNLAQAVQIVAYVLRQAARGEGAGEATPAPEAAAPGVGVGAAAAATATAAAGARVASQEAIEQLCLHLEQALLAIGFLDPAHPKKLMPRLRRLFSRTRLEAEEVDLLRGICRMAELAGHANPPPWKAGPRDSHTTSGETR